MAIHGRQPRASPYSEQLPAPRPRLRLHQPLLKRSLRQRSLKNLLRLPRLLLHLPRLRLLRLLLPRLLLRRQQPSQLRRQRSQALLLRSQSASRSPSAVAR